MKRSILAALAVLMAAAAPVHADEGEGRMQRFSERAREERGRWEPNEIQLRRGGGFSRVIAAQAGASNLVSVDQRGVDNLSSIAQRGDGNIALLRQKGAGNAATITQAGGGNVACVIQRGNGLSTDVAQTGGQSTAYVQTRTGEIHDIPLAACAAVVLGGRRR